jgi:hypothetical protein
MTSLLFLIIAALLYFGAIIGLEIYKAWKIAKTATKQQETPNRTVVGLSSPPAPAKPKMRETSKGVFEWDSVKPTGEMWSESQYGELTFKTKGSAANKTASPLTLLTFGETSFYINTSEITQVAKWYDKYGTKGIAANFHVAGA